VAIVAPLRSEPDETRIILLGTKGGPRPSLHRSNPASLFVSGAHRCLIDCGYGVTRQLLTMHMPPHALTAIYITHHHSDHTLELGAVLYHAWIGGLTKPIDIWGPPPLKHLVARFLEAFTLDITTRMHDEGRPDPEKLFRIHEVRSAGVLTEADDLRVSCARVHHPPLEHAFAFRFDAPRRSIVLSGDTALCPDIVRLAYRADLLVHEVMLTDQLPGLLGTHPNATSLLCHLLASHTSADDVGRVAVQAEVAMLALNHLIPGDDPHITNEMWLAPPSAMFQGPVVLGCDLLVL
jgi:ribonuclease BN (tRNA processing enzyme)